MNIGQLPPFFIWPYALFYLLTKRSLFFMLGVLSTEQQKYQDFCDKLQTSLQRRMEAMFGIVENSLDTIGCRELMIFTMNALFLYFGGILLLMLKLYILIRHLNYVVFAILFYVGSIAFGQSESRQRARRNMSS